MKYHPAQGHAPSAKGCLRSVEAAYKYLVESLKIPASRIVLYGRSIGSGPTLHLASRPYCQHAVGGVVVECGVLSVLRVVLGNAAPVARLLDFFRNEKVIGRVSRPVAVMHGRNDRVVPYTHGEALHGLVRCLFVCRIDLDVVFWSDLG